MTAQASRGRHQAWVESQQRRREFKRRQYIRMGSYLPAFAAFILFGIDGENTSSMLELLPALRDISERDWWAIWASILGAAVLFQFAVEWFFWRCPACEGSLFWKSIRQTCPRCGTKLTDSHLPA